LTQLTYRYEDEKRIDYFVLFSGFSIDKENEFINISVNPKLAYILNQITDNFTKFELEEFTNLHSGYSKTIFRLLKQFRQTGFWKIHIDEFRKLLDVPKSYTTSDLNKRVLKIIMKELIPVFKNLKLTKIKAKKGNKTEYLEFSFKPQDDIRKDGSKTFKDSNGNYYENEIEYFTKEEVKKSFPTP